MIGGTDRYFQIVKCFRDEDLRADRQPEFTQVDVEMSFARPETIYRMIEPLLQVILREIGVEVATPFRLLPYADAIAKYGSDKPDLRFGLEIVGREPRVGRGRVQRVPLDRGEGRRGPGARRSRRRALLAIGARCARRSGQAVGRRRHPLGAQGGRGDQHERESRRRGGAARSDGGGRVRRPGPHPAFGWRGRSRHRSCSAPFGSRSRGRRT